MSKPLNPKEVLATLETWTSSQADTFPGDQPRETTNEKGQTEPIDLERGLARIMCEKEIFMSLVSEFLVDLDYKYPQIIQYFQNRDYQNLSELAHYIKGAAVNLAAEPMSAYAKELEMKAKSGDLEDGEVLVEHIKEEIERMRKYVDVNFG